MSYDLAVWEGPRPRNADEAGEVLDDLLEMYDDSGEPPISAVGELVDRLLARWPDLDAPGGERSPWAMAPLRDGAAGPLLYLSMTTTPLLDEVVDQVTRLASELGLVCYDPQFEELR